MIFIIAMGGCKNNADRLSKTRFSKDVDTVKAILGGKENANVAFLMPGHDPIAFWAIVRDDAYSPEKIDEAWKASMSKDYVDVNPVDKPAYLKRCLYEGEWTRVGNDTIRKTLAGIRGANPDDVVVKVLNYNGGVIRFFLYRDKKDGKALVLVEELTL